MSAKKYLKKVKSTGQLVFDFHKINAEGFPMHLLMSMRGDNGKTFGAKEFLREEFERTGLRNKWVLNTIDQRDADKGKFLVSNRMVNPLEWENYYQKGNKIYKKTEDPDDEDLEFVEFVALSQAGKYKGSREPIGYIIYDEFNEGVSHIGSKQTTLLLNLLGTYKQYDSLENKVKIFIFGNFKSMNSPLIIDLKIMGIHGKEVTKVLNEDEDPLMLILKPVMSEDYIIKRMSKDWLFHLAERTGESDHMYRNDPLNDNTDGVMEFGVMLKPEDVIEVITTYIIDDRFYGLFKFKLDGDVLYGIEQIDEPKGDTITAIKVTDMEHSYKFNSATSRALRGQMSLGDIYFDSYPTKTAICSCLR